MSIAPQRKMKAIFARTIESDVNSSLSRFLTDHGFSLEPDEYNVWINRRRVGLDARINRGDSVTIGPRSIQKSRPRSGTRPRLEQRKKDRGGISALLREWIEEGNEEEQRTAFEEFKKAINETRAREGRPAVYP
jgi:hypothetical protein